MNDSDGGSDSGELDDAADAIMQWASEREGPAPGFPGTDSMSARDAEETSEGHQVGRYNLERQLGRGGQGEVYVARDTKLDRLVALKLFPALAFGVSASRKMRFEREARVASGLDHPGLCSVFDRGIHDGVPFIAMQFVDGESLGRLISVQKGDSGQGIGPVKLPVTDKTEAQTSAIERITLFMEKVAEALHVAHESGVVHRDVKPGNIVIGSGGDPVVVDFGLASDDISAGITSALSGIGVGTPAYMAPEQLDLREGQVDRRVDVYALGATLFESLSLQRPFEAPTQEKLRTQIQAHRVRNLCELNPQVSRDLRTVIETALEKDPDRRYQTAAALAEELKRAREGRPILARPASSFRRLRSWVNRNRAVSALVGLIIVMMLSSIAVLGNLNQELTRVVKEESEGSDASRMLKLREEAQDLWPAGPSQLQALQKWLGRAAELKPRLALHRLSLKDLRARGRKLAPEDRANTYPLEAKRATEMKATIGLIEERLPFATATRELESLKERRKRLKKELESITSKMKYVFSSNEDLWRYDVLTQLVRDLRAFYSSAGPVRSVEARLKFAKEVHSQTIGSDHAGWVDLRKALKEDPNYSSATMSSFLGLIPLGRDPHSSFLEFLHLKSHQGDVPKRNQSGTLKITADTGVVFVLLPGGSYTQGEAGMSRASPPREVTLAPFLISKYEMTQRQFFRVMGKRPSQFRKGEERIRPPITDLHPVERVTWNDCAQVAFQLGLDLPTGAQWEYAARGGTTYPWWTGPTEKSLYGKINQADASAAAMKISWPTIDHNVTDGYGVHAPVDAYGPNPFGLYCIAGNVGEWCRDAPGDYGQIPLPGSGENPQASIPFIDWEKRMFRGGRFSDGAAQMKSAKVESALRTQSTNDIGLRLSLDLQ